MNSIFDYTIEMLEEYFVSIGEKKFKAKQVFEWLYQKRVKSFDEMSISEKEDWYDLIYNQALMLYILFDYQSRKEKIRNFKDSL